MLLLEPDAERRATMTRMLRASGISVTAVSRIAEIERWPVGEVAIVDAAWFTPWWITMGVSHIVVQVDTPEEGAALCARGAARWINRRADPKDVVSTLLAVAEGTTV